jgi:hypothetical protein
MYDCNVQFGELIRRDLLLLPSVEPNEQVIQETNKQVIQVEVGGSYDTYKCIYRLFPSKHYRTDS